MSVTTTDTVRPLTDDLSGGIPAGSSSDPALTADQQSAKGVLAAALAQFGLSSLASWAWAKELAGEPLQQVLLEMRQTPEYKTRYPAMEALDKAGNGITEQQYQDYESGFRQSLSAHGIPLGIYDNPDQIASYLVGNKSLAELDRRLTKAQESAYNAPPEVKSEFSRLYGTQGPGLTTAYWLDPTVAEPQLEKQYTAAQIAAQAQMTRFGQLNLGQAETLATQGVDANTAQQGFTALGRLGDILKTQQNGESQITTDQALAAQFTGDTDAQRAIAQRASRRTAAFTGGGDVSGGASGYTGAGSAQGA